MHGTLVLTDVKQILHSIKTIQTHFSGYLLYEYKTNNDVGILNFRKDVFLLKFTTSAQIKY